MNFQNLPRKDKVIKRAFVPKLNALLSFDYEQIELRLLAYYMNALGDSSMVDAFLAGRDLHDESASAALRITGALTDEQRQVGKVLNYSIVYGGGRPTIMRQLGLDWKEAGSLLLNYHRRWPGISLVQDQIRRRMEERGYITTLWGRHLHPESDHKALNALVQGCAADLMKAALVKTGTYLAQGDFTSHLVSSIHDEILIDALMKEVPVLAKEIPIYMDHPPVSQVIPVASVLEWSTTNWADKIPYEEEPHDDIPY